MRSVSIHALAEEGTRAAWAHVMVLQHSVEDMGSTYAAGDWATCVDSCFDTVLNTAYVSAMLAGHLGSPEDAALLVRIARDIEPHAVLLERMPTAWEATRADADAARILADEACHATEAAMPIVMASFRTPTGFYPSVRMAGDLEKLRRRSGLRSYAWEHFAT
ncbi:hypothetical protein [Nocardia mexicana]|uniref:Uncharacterized protein n=1 Tax=Nocardia mexicana TaxID=279262 RepID=A0A370HE98_9NOCA|nr:hypothetical protein [Nocardia mexicana]RDI55574.1 hypothetical protein DFR68_101407 [Nocardia mexicana]